MLRDAGGARIVAGDCRAVLRTLPDESVHCIVTSPPYWRQRDYEADAQIGREPSSGEYVANIVGVMAECSRVLRKDGTLWLNLGDSREGLSLAGIPWRVALALIADGWILRQDIIWHKLRPMPDGAKNRPSIAHEYLFLFTRSDSYFYDADAVREPVSQNSHGGRKPNPGSKASGVGNHKGGSLGLIREDGLRNRRSVWSIAGTPFPGAHCAPFPVELVEPCILAGCPEGGMVLDPFGGAGTTGLAAMRMGRNATLIELNPSYVETARQRLGIFAEKDTHKPRVVTFEEEFPIRPVLG